MQVPQGARLGYLPVLCLSETALDDEIEVERYGLYPSRFAAEMGPKKIRSLVAYLWYSRLDRIFSFSMASQRNDFVATVWRDLDVLTDDELRALYAEQRAEGLAWLKREAVDVDRLLLLRSADMCYVGQSFELTVPFPVESDAFDTADLAAWFHERHFKVYGHADPKAPVRLLNIRTQIVGEMPKPEFRDIQAGPLAKQASAPKRKVFDQGREEDVAVVHRSTLEPGQDLAGPLIVEQYDTTIYVPRGFAITVDPHLNIIGAPA